VEQVTGYINPEAIYWKKRESLKEELQAYFFQNDSLKRQIGYRSYLQGM
jgi:hypothetical protein